MTLVELQIDGLIGPTHNYAGLSTGNVASMSNIGHESHPAAAARQGLAKMKFVASLGIPQAVMPPHCRPDIDALRGLGFTGDDAAVLAQAARTDATLLAQVSSASSMWTANAATITPSCDAADGRVHLTPANLRCKFHRAIEPPQTSRLLKAILPSDTLFTHHPWLPGTDQYGDEGAANHTRLTTSDSTVHLYVYGQRVRDTSAPCPRSFPARQTLEASQAIVRQHGTRGAMFVQQSPDVIDAGVFHNDVIAVGTDNVLLMHEDAFLNGDQVIQELYERLGGTFTPLIVQQSELSVQEAVRTYLFNSQLLATPEGMIIIAPSDAAEHPASKAVLDRLVSEETPIKAVHTLDVRESMHNGGGPACLRLRVDLRPDELRMVHAGVMLTDTLAANLETWIDRFYPDTLSPADLADPDLLVGTRDALQALTDLLQLGSVYPFQQ